MLRQRVHFLSYFFLIYIEDRILHCLKSLSPFPCYLLHLRFVLVIDCNGQYSISLFAVIVCPLTDCTKGVLLSRPFN